MTCIDLYMYTKSDGPSHTWGMGQQSMNQFILYYLCDVPNVRIIKWPTVHCEIYGSRFPRAHRTIPYATRWLLDAYFFHDSREGPEFSSRIRFDPFTDEVHHLLAAQHIPADRDGSLSFTLGRPRNPFHSTGQHMK